MNLFEVKKVKQEFGVDLPALYTEVAINRHIIDKLKEHITGLEQDIQEMVY